MIFKLWLYPKWLRLSSLVNKWLEDAYVKYHNAKNLAAAEKFLRKFRKNHDGLYAQQRPLPNPKCKHLKGGGAIRSHYKDYNIGCHTFIDGRTKIWCLNGCGFVSWEGQKSFVEATRMLEQSNNTKSSSERTIIIAQGMGSNVRRP